MTMKPVAIFQHTHVGHPGAALPVLDELGVPWVLVPIMEGAAVPSDPEPYSGLIFMGGAMGVNDGLPWIADEMQLIRRAHDAGLPVAGHCLGSQIVAAAFGADVRKNRLIEIGWQNIEFESTPIRREWFGDVDESCVFQWHGDTFDLPSAAVRVATNPYCDNQAFVLDDRHVGMQFHLEMTPELVRVCLDANGKTLDREITQGNPAVNARADLLTNLDERTAVMHALMKTVYQRWIKGLKK